MGNEQLFKDYLTGVMGNNLPDYLEKALDNPDYTARHKIIAIKRYAAQVAANSASKYNYNKEKRQSLILIVISSITIIFGLTNACELGYMFGKYPNDVASIIAPGIGTLVSLCGPYFIGSTAHELGQKICKSNQELEKFMNGVNAVINGIITAEKGKQDRAL